jgi:RNA polymerase sigma factor, sigma-70 family
MVIWALWELAEFSVAGKKGEGRERPKRHDPDEQVSKAKAAPGNSGVDSEACRLLATTPEPRDFVKSILSQVADSDHLNHYLEEIASIPPLTADEEKELIASLNEPGRKGEKARQRLNEGYLRLVVWISKEFAGGSVQFMDLIDEGAIGLLEAVNAYEPGTVPFPDYITSAVKNHISQTLAEETRASRVPDYLLERVTSIKKIARDLALELQREPSQEEVAGAMGLSLDELERLIKLVGQAEAEQPSESSEEEESYDPTGVFEDYSEEDF